MLFTSLFFIYAFFPATVVVFFLLARRSTQCALLWLTAVSLFFYGWTDPSMLPVLIASIAFNYACGIVLRRSDRRTGKLVLIGAVAVDIACLGYYKYLGFLAGNANALFGTGFEPTVPVLPLGISFFTFTQVAYLADAYRGAAPKYRLAHYGLFVTFFPHLIAGPIYHHREMVPQFERRTVFTWENCAVGVSIFALGLAKKVLLADRFGLYADAHFAADRFSLVDAWAGALSFTLQIYFDFSAYTDMAIGISRVFGIVLPANFMSPYKSASIIEFWRRWHMTLSRFLRDYVYIPLGGSRSGTARRHVNLMLTMLIGGLWHGASWNFVIWGGLHGCYLVINHSWRAFGSERYRLPRVPSVAVTFLAVVAAWVFFRADTTDKALAMLAAMAGLNGIVLPDAWQSLMGASPGIRFEDMPLFPGLVQIAALAGGLAIVWLMPNTLEIFAAQGPVLAAARTASAEWQSRFAWRPGLAWGAIVLLSFFASVATLAQHDEYRPFIYFQF